MRNWLTISSAVLAAASLPAQVNVISAKAGLIHYTEGDVTLDLAAVDTTKPGKFSEMKNGSLLRTSEGRAEVLLASPSFVRLGERSGLRMLNNSLAETRFEITAGEALIEAAELAKNTAITVVAGPSTITIEKAGIYRVEMGDSPLVKVYDGEVTLANSGKTTVVKAGRSAGLATGGDFVLAKFDNKVGDELYRWSKRRSGYVSLANVAAANSVYTNGYSMAQGSWLWNPYFGMYTAVPMRGFYRSPFGYRYYNPRQAYNFVTQPVYAASSGRSYDSTYGAYGGTGSMNPTYNSGYGYSTVESRSSGGYSGGYSGSSGAGAASAPAAAGGDGGGRGASAGGGGGSMGGGQSGGGGSRGGN